MPKFSVYVPDALWARVQRESGDLNMSQFVQRALQDLVASRSVAATLVTRKPALDAERVERIRQRYAVDAERAFAEGYEFGLTLAEQLPADALIKLKEWDFALADYELKDNWEPWMHSIPGVIGRIEASAEEHFGATWREVVFVGSVAAHGAVAALQDVWSHLFGSADELEDDDGDDDEAG